MKKEDVAKLCCSFCGKNQREVRKLIAGPTVYICDECIKLCNDIIAKEAQRAEPAPDTSTSRPETQGRATESGRQLLCCSFCGKSQREVSKLLAGPSTYICDECIGLCNDIIAEEIDREDVTATVRSRLPEDARVSIARILDRGSTAAARVSSFTRDRNREIFAAIRDGDSKLTREQFRRRFLEESAKVKPPFEILARMEALGSKWNELHRIVGRQTSDLNLEPRPGTSSEPASSPPGTEDPLHAWVRHITERLRFTLEVLEALASRIEEPGFEPSHHSLAMARDRLVQAHELLTAGPPGAPVD